MGESNGFLFIYFIRRSSNGRTPGFPACRRAGVQAINASYMKYYVYILLNLIPEKIGKWSYVGSTFEIKKRFKEHATDKTKSTKTHRPLKIIHIEEFANKQPAHKRELFLKSGFGREEKESIIRSGIV